MEKLGKLEEMFQKTDADLEELSRRLDVECEAQVSSAELDKAEQTQLLHKIADIKSEYQTIVEDAKQIQKIQTEAVKFFQETMVNACQALMKLQLNGAQGEKPEELDKLEKLLGMTASASNLAGGCSNTAVSSDSTTSSNNTATTDTGTCCTETVQATSQTTPIAISQTTSMATSQTTPIATSQTASTAHLAGACSNTAEATSQTTSSSSDKESMKEHGLKPHTEITDEQFLSVSSLIRGRVKLKDVNMVYQILWHYFTEDTNRDPLSPADMHRMGLEVTGKTGEAKLHVLRVLKLASISRNGDVMLL